MTAVPDPRFRDQLADEIENVLIDIRSRIAGVFAPYMVGGAPNTLACELADEAIPDSYWEAEVEARVQAAANQRAAEERHHFTQAMAALLRLTYSVQLESGSRAARAESERVADVFRARIYDHCRERDRRARAAALAQPAPRDQP